MKDKIRGLFAVCGNMGRLVGLQQTTMFIDDHLAKLSGLGNVPAKVFLGRMTADLFDEEARKQMEDMGPLEDWDNLKLTGRSSL